MHPAALVAALALAQDIPAVPPPMDPNQIQPTQPVGTPAEIQTKSALDNSEANDSGRNFELFYIDAGLGASYIDMRQFSQDSLAIEKASSAGPAFNIGAGIRLLLLVAGVRARYNALSAFNMWQLNGEIGLKIPISKVDLLIGLHGGYSFVGRVSDASISTATPTNADSVKVRGFNAGLEVALDYYVTPLFSVGLGVNGDFLYLTRPPADLPAGLTDDEKAAVQSQPLYQQSGTSAGLEINGGLRLGVHFGL